MDYTAWVEGGGTLGEIYYRTVGKSSIYGFHGGACSNVVSVAHCWRGFRHVMEKVQLTADHVIVAPVVDINGRILGRDLVGEDLIWAIRGGGLSSFAVIMRGKSAWSPFPACYCLHSVQENKERSIN